MGVMTSDVTMLRSFGKYKTYENSGVVVCNCPMWNATAVQYTIEPGETMAGSCDHTWATVKEGQDTEENLEVFLRGNVYVPIFFGREGKRSGMWVRIVTEEERNGMLPYYHLNPRPEVQRFDNPSDELHDIVTKPIGWMEPHEGRWNLRGAILEWLRGVYLHLPTCGYKYHHEHLFSWAEREKKNADSRKPDVLVNVMQMLDTGLCFACVAANTSTVDDLIPDV